MLSQARSIVWLWSRQPLPSFHKAVEVYQVLTVIIEALVNFAWLSYFKFQIAVIGYYVRYHF